MVPQPPSSRPQQNRRSATVMVAELFGLGGLAKQADQPAVRQLLLETWRRISGIIREFNGELAGFLGEELVAVWYADGLGGDAEPAIDCGLALRRLPAAMAAAGRPGVFGKLSFKIGISSGEVFSIPNPHADGQAGLQGQPVDTARRLAAVSEADTILIGPGVFRRVQGVFRLHKAGERALAGKTGPISTYFVEERKTYTSRVRYTGAGGLETRLVGRDREFLALRSMLESLEAAADPFLVLVVGPDGMGKSRLLFEFAGEIESAAADTITMSVRNLVEFRDAPFSMWRNLLRQRFGIRDGMEEAEARETLLKGVLQAWGKRLGRHTAIEAAHFISELAGLSWPGSAYLQAYQGNPVARNQKAGELLRELFQRMSDTARLILFVDDLPWADSASVELLLRLLQGGGDALPMLVVAGSNPEYLAEYPEWGQLAYRTIELGPIPYSMEMTAVAFPELQEIPDALRARMIRKVGGNPLYLEEIARHIHFSRTPGEEMARKLSAAYPIPDTLQGLVHMRFEQVSQAAREVLQLASVTGRVFWRGCVLAEARQPVGTGLLNLPAGVLEDVVDRALEELVRNELAFRRTDLVLGGEWEYIFKHQLIREAAYDKLPVKYRKFYHFAAAKWLAEHAGPDRQAAIARHFEIAGNVSSALRHYQYALAYAAERGIPAEAEALERRIRDIRLGEQASQG